MGQILTGAVVTALERRGQPKTVQQGNREWTTVIQGVNATGWAIPPFIIFKGRHHLSNGWTINELGLQWLKHFDEHTKRRVIGAYRLLIIDSYESYDLLEFQQYCKDNKIITICMPPHSSHLLQPLDVGCFAPLKKALVLFDLERVILALDVRIRTLLLLTVEDRLWQSQTPTNKAATRRKSHKRKRVQEEGTLTVEDGLRRTTLKEFGARSDRKKAKKQIRAGAGELSQRRCGRCNETGHNARTCKKAVEVDSE
ncbi:hypothetical protein HBI59_250890 [Parastagonospora nodorum]|nr:hypothetical protein HBI59_250890 [Parastagonospora nodorum]